MPKPSAGCHGSNDNKLLGLDHLGCVQQDEQCGECALNCLRLLRFDRNTNSIVVPDKVWIRTDFNVGMVCCYLIQDRCNIEFICSSVDRPCVKWSGSEPLA